ncbi:unnamed protein product [Rotaria sp. Silwood2]|nr:unnamed protein product [Rotaria sp. Silwood2]CAF3246386.1 unnamed protein product [Rotaria sp. Silwood2]CAF4214402.1 unnamed protein product [Rotaria sp. Silwood2]
MNTQNRLHIIWLNETQLIADDYVHSGFSSFINNIANNIGGITISHDRHECIDQIHEISQQENKTTKILLIILTPLSLEDIVKSAFVQLMEDLVEVDSMYLFSFNTTKNLIHLPEGTKIRGFHTGFDVFPATTAEESETASDDQIEQQQKSLWKSRLKSEDFIFNSLPSLDASASSSSISQENTTRQEADFMYAELLRGILIDIDSTEDEMIHYCRQKYAANKKQLAYIEEFKEYYDPCNAIFWYTRDTFLYRLLNTALREQDIDTLYALRYFIKHLHEQLMELYTSSITKADNTEDQYTETTFLSTTATKELAEFFIGGNTSNDNTSDVKEGTKHILFKIEIDKTVNKFPYANISGKSAFGDDEGEILFTMGAVFRIVSVNETDNSLLNVTLKLTGEEDEDLHKLTVHMKADIVQPIPLISLAKLMGATARYMKAEQFYLLSLNDSVVTQDAGCIAAVYNDLGLNYKLMKQMDEAVKCFQTSIDLKIKYLTNAHINPSLAITYSNLGGIYFAQQEYEVAAVMYRNAARIYRNKPDSNQISLSTCYNNIATICKELERYEDALLMYEKSLEIRLSILPSTHPMIATVYNNIAQVYYSQGKSDKASEYWKKALEIQQNSLPSDHPLLGRTYQSIAIALHEHGHIEQALEYAKKSHKIKLAKLPADHPKIIEENEWISNVEQNMHSLNL